MAARLATGFDQQIEKLRVTAAAKLFRIEREVHVDAPDVFLG